MAMWRNWQTRATQNRVSSEVWVRLPPSPPIIIVTRRLFRLVSTRTVRSFFKKRIARRVFLCLNNRDLKVGIRR